MSRATNPVTIFIQEHRGLSTLATGQMEQMIDDAAWLTYAADEGLDLAKKLRHQESSSDRFAREVEIGIGLYIAFVVRFTRRTYKFKHSCEN
jgi:hypothetical protein